MSEHIEVHQAPDKSFHVTFGDAEGITVGALAAALASLPPDKLLYDVCTTFFDPDNDECEGQPVYDEDHWVGITTIATEPEVCGACGGELSDGHVMQHIAEEQAVVEAAEALLS
jgi:hypothetical protein